MHTLPLLLAAAAALALAGGHETGATVDLSAGWEFADDHNANPGATALNDALSAQPSIRAGLLIENGKVAASYYREGVDPGDIYPVFSVTKSITSLLIGLLVDDGLLSLDETLGDVFPDEDGTVWSNVEESGFVSNVTIREMLTMTSGLVSPNDFNMFDLQDLGGGSLAGSLSYPEIGTEGQFSYLSTSNILSYVIEERSGMKPMDLMSERVFPALGIDPSVVGWSMNRDGQQHSYHGLSLTAAQMGKFGLLFLQNGLASEDAQVISSEWVNESTADHVANTAFPFVKYGYLWWIVDGPSFAMPHLGRSYCAFGLGGQQICARPDIGRVWVQQNDLEFGASEDDLAGDQTAMFIALDENTDFGSSDDPDSPDETAPEVTDGTETAPTTALPAVQSNTTNVGEKTTVPTAAPSKSSASAIASWTGWSLLLLTIPNV